jgi:hypothetical protein
LIKILRAKFLILKRFKSEIYANENGVNPSTLNQFGYINNNNSNNIQRLSNSNFEIEENHQIQIIQSQQSNLDEEKSQIQLKNIPNNNKQLIFNEKKQFNNNQTLSISNKNIIYSNNEKIEEMRNNERNTDIKSENKDINHPIIENMEKSKYLTASCAKNDYQPSSIDKNNNIINILYSNSNECSIPISESLLDNQSKTISNICMVNEGLILKEDPMLNKVNNSN